MSLVISLLKFIPNSHPRVLKLPEFVLAADCPKEPGKVFPGDKTPFVSL